MPYASLPTELPNTETPRKRFARVVASIVTVALVTLGLGVSPAFAEVATEEPVEVTAPVITEAAPQTLAFSQVEESPASSSRPPEDLIDIVVDEADAGEAATETKAPLIQDQSLSQEPEVSNRGTAPATTASYYEAGSISGRVTFPSGMNYWDIEVFLVDAAAEWDVINYAYPDRIGRYTFYDVEPGKYKIQFVAYPNEYWDYEDWDTEHWNDQDWHGDISIKIEQWWENKPDFNSASVINLYSGESTESINANIVYKTLKASTPTITGTKKLGSTLTAERGTWTSGTAFKYQWYRNGEEISKATTTKYKLVASDIGKQISVKVTGKKTGYDISSKISAETLPVTSGTLQTSTPTITGSVKVGSTLTAKPGTWTSGTTLKYQWYRNGKAISKATSTTYKLVKADVGKQISVKVTGTKSGYNSVSKTKAINWDLKTAKPTITGTKKVGSTLTAKPGTWTSGTAFKYQWYRNGKAISKATSTKYKLVASDAGKQISVKVAGTKSGYNAASKTSIKTTTIAKQTLTFAQKQAVERGKSYLKYGSGFSRQDLIDQLIYESFSKKDATVAVDYINPSWNKQAAIKAENYLKYVGGFSRQGLIDQLRYEGFTQKQAEYGVKAVGY